MSSLRPPDDVLANGESVVTCAVCGLRLPVAMLAEHIQLVHLPNDLQASVEGERRALADLLLVASSTETST